MIVAMVIFIRILRPTLIIFRIRLAVYMRTALINITVIAILMTLRIAIVVILRIIIITIPVAITVVATI